MSYRKTGLIRTKKGGPPDGGRPAPAVRPQLRAADIMKKTAIFALCACVLMSGCSGKAQKEQDESFATIDIIDTVDDLSENLPDSQTESLPEDMTDSTDYEYESPGGTQDIALDVSPLKIEKNQVVADEAGVLITQTGAVVNGINGPGVELKIENKNNFPISLTGDHIVANSLTTAGSVSWDLEKGETMNGVLYAPVDELKAAGIQSVGLLTAEISVRNSETGEDIGSFTLRIEPEGQAEEQDTSFFGDLLYDGDYAAVFGKYVQNDPEWGTGLVLTVHNKTDKRISAQCSEAFADGLYMIPGYTVTCEPGTYSMDKQNYMASVLQENGQEDFETASVILKIYSEETYEELEETPVLNVAK